MITQIKSRHIANTRIRRSKSIGYAYTFEDRIEDYIKINMGIKKYGNLQTL